MSLGRNPSPGGAWNVWRMLERMETDLVGSSCCWCGEGRREEEVVVVVVVVDLREGEG